MTPHKTLIQLLAVLLLSTLSLTAQEINLDKPTKCGDMLCYPLYDDPNTFYYLPDRPRLAYKNGKPQFSFLKYARLEDHEKAGIGETGGGGIVHFLVTYGAAPQRVLAAQEALRQTNPKAKLEGPIVYRKGHFALVTSFTKENKTFTKAVAVGKAPLMEGQKAAVSIALTKEGAQILWESFKSATPDISLVFEMEFAGVREPYKATIEGDWKRIATSHKLQAGFKYAWFGADVDMLFQELRQSGAIKISAKGEDKGMDEIIESANAYLLKMMFEPAPPDELTRAEQEKGGYSNLDKALELLKFNKKMEQKSQNKERSSAIPARYDYHFLDPTHTRAVTQNSFFSLVTPAYADVGDGFSTTDFRQFVDRCLGGSLQQSFDPTHLPLDEIKYCQRKSFEFYGYAPMLAEPEKSAVKEAFKLYHVELPKLFQEYCGVAKPTTNQCVNQSDMEKAKNFSLFFMKMIKNALDSVSKSLTKGKQHTTSSHNSAQHESLKEKTKRYYTYVKKRCASWGGDYCVFLNKMDEKRYKRCKYRVAYLLKRPKYLTEEEIQRLKATQDLLEKRGTCSTKEEADKIYQEGVVCYGKIRSAKYKVPLNEIAKCLSVLKMPSFLKKSLPDWKQNRLDQMTRNLKKHISTKRKISSHGTDHNGTSHAPSPNSSGNQHGHHGSQKAKQPPHRTKSHDNNISKHEPPKPSKKKKGTEKGVDKIVKKLSKPHSISLVASYRLRHIKRSGHFKMTLNRFRTENQAFIMSENIGDLYGRWGNDTSVFRAVLIDDPVFKQRDIFVTLDGQDANTFNRHINFVTVHMRKRHQNGALTTDEVVITPELFNEKGNHFVLRYGWKGDNDREAWLGYEIKATWSFHGGVEIETPWQKRTDAMVSLTPPFHYRTVTIEGEGDTLTRHGVRHAVIEFTSTVEGKTLTNRITIKNRGTAPSIIVDIPEGADGKTTATITWHLKGGKKVISKPIPVTGEILYWDELEV